MKYDKVLVFLNSSRKDEREVLATENVLSKMGVPMHNIFRGNRRILSDREWGREIIRVIGKANLFLFLWTNNIERPANILGGKEIPNEEMMDSQFADEGRRKDEQHKPKYFIFILVAKELNDPLKERLKEYRSIQIPFENRDDFVFTIEEKIQIQIEPVLDEIQNSVDNTGEQYIQENLEKIRAVATLLESQYMLEEALSLYLYLNDKQTSLSDSRKIGLYISIARLYYLLGRYRDAEVFYQQAQVKSEALLGKDHPSTLQSLYALALLYQAQGRYNDAEVLYQQVRSMQEKLLGKSHRDTLTTLTNLAKVYQAQGRYYNAETLYRQVQTILEGLLGKSHPDTLTTLTNLAKVYQAQGRYDDDAETLLQQIRSMQEKALGDDHPDALTTLTNLARVYLAQGRYDDAQKLYESARVRMKEALGEEHPETLKTLTSLAEVYLAQGRYDDAQKLYESARVRMKEVLGVDHPDTLRTLTSLAEVYLAQGRYDDAQKLYESARVGMKEVLEVDHPDTLRTLTSLAEVYRDQGRYDDAQKLYESARVRMKEVLGVDHPDTLRTLTSLAEVYRDQGRYDDAQKLYESARVRMKEALGEEHPETLKTLTNLAEVSFVQGRYGKAQELYKIGLVKGEEKIPKIPLSTLDVSWNLIEISEALEGDYGSKLGYELSHKLTEILERQNLSPICRLQTMEKLAYIYEKQEDHKQAEEKYKEIIKLSTGEDVSEEITKIHLQNVNNLVYLYAKEERAQDIKSLYNDVKEQYEERKTSLYFLRTMIIMGENIKHQKEDVREEIFNMVEKILMEKEYSKTIIGMRLLARVYQARDEDEKANDLFKQIDRYVEET